MTPKPTDLSILSPHPHITLLRVQDGISNAAGEIYDRQGTFIDFPRELDSKQRRNFDTATVAKRLRDRTVACLVHERTNYSYFHWIFETLPKFIYLSKHRDQYPVDRFYYHCGLWGTPYQRQALRVLGLRRWQLLDARRVASVGAATILVVKLEEERRNPSPFLCQMIREAFVKTPPERPFRRIYLTRKNVKSGRKIINEAAVEALLTSLNFQIVDPAKLSFMQQVKLFSESAHVVSPHGAALANLVFCKGGTKVVELFNHGDIRQGSQSYPNMARTCGFELVRLPANRAGEGGAEYSNRADFAVDMERLRSTLGGFGL